MDQISLFPDMLGEDIIKCIDMERERTCSIGSDEYISQMKTYHEGYGYIAECFENITSYHKSIKADMQKYIACVKDEEIVKVNISCILKALLHMTAEAVRMAAIAGRIERDITTYDIYYSRRDSEELLGHPHEAIYNALESMRNALEGAEEDEL